MQFFLYEVAARIVAIYLCFDCARKVRRGLLEGKIAYFNPDLLNWLLDWSDQVARRDAAPVRYWIQIVIHAITLLACLFVAIFGWRQPGA